MARPVEKGAPEIKAGIDEYFALCEERGEFPDEAGMWVHLEILPRDIPRYSAKDGVQVLLDVAKMRRESCASRRMFKEPKVAQGCMNLLKQEKNGGYDDRSNSGTANAERKLTIKMDGVGKGAFG